MKKINIRCIIILLVIIVFNGHALTEQEEKDLYNEFLQMKQSESKNEFQGFLENESKKDEKNDELSRYLAYENRKKSPMIAVGLSFYFPTAGHLYAEDWLRGAPFLLADVVGLYLIFSNLNWEKVDPNCVSYGDGSYCETRYVGNKDTLELGAYIFAISMVWEKIDVYLSIKDYNQKLKERLGLGVEFGWNHEDIRAGIAYHL